MWVVLLKTCTERSDDSSAVNLPASEKWTLSEHLDISASFPSPLHLKPAHEAESLHRTAADAGSQYQSPALAILKKNEEDLNDTITSVRHREISTSRSLASNPAVHLSVDVFLFSQKLIKSGREEIIHGSFPQLKCHLLQGLK